MKHTIIVFFLVLTALAAPSCSRKSGCPSDSAQTKMNRSGEYKASKTKSGLLPPTKNYKGEKRYKPKHKEVHKN